MTHPTAHRGSRPTVTVLDELHAWSAADADLYADLMRQRDVVVRAANAALDVPVLSPAWLRELDPHPRHRPAASLVSWLLAR